MAMTLVTLSTAGNACAFDIFSAQRYRQMKKVLIVDDAAFIRKTLKLMLEKYGFEVVGEAENGIAAMMKIQTLDPDIVTLDITMPDMDGIACLK